MEVVRWRVRWSQSDEVRWSQPDGVIQMEVVRWRVRWSRQMEVVRMRVRARY